MAACAWLLGLILGIPLFGFAVSSGIRAHFDSELRAEAVKQVPDADPASIAALTVAQLCGTPDPDTADLCQTDRNLAVVRTASLASGVTGLGLLLLIALAGFAARSNRAVLLALFRPGLYFTALTITGLILVDAVIVIASIYYGEAALGTGVHVGIILAIGLGAILGVAAVGRSAFGVVQRAETFAVGKEVTSREAERLWQQTAQVAKKLGALPPDHVVIGR